MSRFIHVAAIEDKQGKRHQFHAESEDALYALLGDWVTERWQPEMGVRVEDPVTRVEDFFEWESTFAGPGSACELWVLDPIPVGFAVGLEKNPAEFVEHRSDLGVIRGIVRPDRAEPNCSKGGVNSRPTSPCPPPPHGQG